MEQQNIPEPSRFPTFGRCVHAVFSRRALYVLVALVTLVALYHAEENFRGKRAWDRYRNEAEARGVKFDFAAFIPPPIPEEQNAAANPIVQEWFPKPQPNDPNWPPLRGNAENRIASRKNPPERRATERFVDLVAMKEALAEEQSGKKKTGRSIAEQSRTPQERAGAAAAVLEALQVYQPALDAMRAAAKRPHVRYPIDYKLDDPFSILLPHLAKIKSMALELSLEADAKLAAGRVDDAFADVMFMLWLTDSMRQEPFIIDHLVRVACLQITMQPLWEGMAEHKWTDTQLQRFQERLQQFDFVNDMQEPVASERAASIGMMERLRRNPRSRPGLNDLFDTSRPFATCLTTVVPRGWFYLEALNYSTLMDDQMRDGVNLQKRTFNARALEENKARMDQALKDTGPALILGHRFFAKALLPALKNATRKFALGQVTADEGALACALERYRLAHGKLPESLDALVPKFIAKVPHDVLTGGPLKYERLNDNDFVLSSAGWAATSVGETQFPESEKPKDRPGEWIWRSAP